MAEVNNKQWLVLRGDASRMDNALERLRTRMERLSPHGRSAEAAVQCALEQSARLGDMRLLTVEHQQSDRLLDQLARYAHFESLEATRDIRPWLAALSQRLDQRAKERLTLPPDHGYRFEAESECSWVVRGYGHQISAHIYRQPPERHDETQFKIEMRLWVDEPKAHVFAWQGKVFWAQHKDLLEHPLMFVSAEDHEALVDLTVERAAQAIAIADKNRATATSAPATRVPPTMRP